MTPNTKTPVSINASIAAWESSSRFLGGRIAPTVISAGGNNFIVFGGYDEDAGANLSNGAIYNVVDDTWIPIPDMGDGFERSGPAVIWAVNKLIVWGGYTYNGTFTYYNSGAVYDPATKIWTPMSTAGAPSRVAAMCALIMREPMK